MQGRFDLHAPLHRIGTGESDRRGNCARQLGVKDELYSVASCLRTLIIPRLAGLELWLIFTMGYVSNCCQIFFDVTLFSFADGKNTIQRLK